MCRLGIPHRCGWATSGHRSAEVLNRLNKSNAIEVNGLISCFLNQRGSAER